MKKSRAETSGALSGEFADRVRPPYASDEKRRQAAELFAHGIGYQRASRILDLPANTLRDWARAWRAGKFRTTISPHLYRYSDAVGWGTQGQGHRAVLPDSIFSFSRMISDPFWGEPCPSKGSSAADCSQMLSLA